VVAILGCGIAAADTIIAGGLDATRGEYSVWVKEDGANSNTYFSNAIETELTRNIDEWNRGALSIDLFTDISLETASGISATVASQITLASNAAPSERIVPVPPISESVPASAQAPGSQLASLAQHRGRKLRSRQVE
jgi:hypothetical protein